MSRFIEIRSDISSQRSTPTDIRGDVGRLVKVIGRMLTLPHLKQLTFRGNLDPYIEQLIKHNEEKRDIIAIVPYQKKY